MRPFRRETHKIFSLDGLIKSWEVTPVVFLTLASTSMTVAASIYAIFTKNYVMDSHRKPMHERMNLLKPYPMKLLTINQKYEPMPYLYSLLKCMGDAERQLAKKKRLGCHDEEYKIVRDDTFVPWTSIKSDHKGYKHPTCTEDCDDEEHKHDEKKKS